MLARDGAQGTDDDQGLGAHRDAGFLSMILQDDVGGLQAQSAEHGWIDVEPRPGGGSVFWFSLPAA